MYQESKCAILKGTSSYIFDRVVNIPRFQNRVLNMSGFIKKTLHHIDAWQGSDYSSVSAYTRVLNLPVLHKVVKKMLHD